MVKEPLTHPRGAQRSRFCSGLHACKTDETILSVVESLPICCHTVLKYDATLKIFSVGDPPHIVLVEFMTLSKVPIDGTQKALVPLFRNLGYASDRSTSPLAELEGLGSLVLPSTPLVESAEETAAEAIEQY